MTVFPKVNLLPCAHCGDDDVHLIRTVHDNVVYWHVECYGCGMRTNDMPESMTYNYDYHNCCHDITDTIDCAVDIWNRRVKDEPVDDDHCMSNTFSTDEGVQQPIISEDVRKAVEAIRTASAIIKEAFKHV